MVERRTFVAHLAQIIRLADAPGWAIPVVVGLGLVAAVLEALGLILFIPLLQSLGAPVTRVGRLQDFFDIFGNLVSNDLLSAFIVFTLCVIIICKNAVTILNTWVIRYIDGDISHRIRTRIFEQILSSCVDYRPGVVRTDIATTVTITSWAVGSGFTLTNRMIVSMSTVLVFAFLMVSISWALTVFAMLGLAVTGAVIRFSTRQADTTGQAVVKDTKAFGMRMWESIESLQMIRAFGRERFEENRFRKMSDLMRRQLLKQDLFWALPGPISEITITILIGALILAAQSTQAGLAALAAFLSLLYRMQGPVRDILQSKVALDGLAGSIDDVEEILTDSRVPLLASGKRTDVSITQGLEICNVSFRYAPDQPWALEDVSFSIPAGKTTAIIGESGAGKSTLLSLLFRFQDPTHGLIAADGVPLPLFDLACWRSRLALMSQDVQLFNDTIAANIGYGRLDATPGEVAAAAQVARADGFIAALPGAYNALAGDRGLRLSGGQRQRIALARTILRDPELLLLDEATNALDVESEQAFQLALERYSRQRTVVVIAHRLATIQNADQVIVMSKGRVIEAGAPATLLRDGRHYARLFSLHKGSTAADDTG